MRRKFNFGKIDFYGRGKKLNSVAVEVEYSDRNGKKVFSACGEIWNGNHSDIICGGQCLDEIAQFINDPTFRLIYDLWKKYHLNDMHAECEHQEAMGWKEIAGTQVKLRNGETTTLGWCREHEHPDGILGKACPICGYKYGSAWLYRPIPFFDENVINDLLTGCAV